MTPAIGARVQPRLRSSGNSGGHNNQQQQQQQQQQSPPGESGLKAQIRGKPRTTPMGQVRIGNKIWARYRMESIVDVPVALIDSRGKTIPLKQQLFPLPMPQLPGNFHPDYQSQNNNNPTPQIRTLQDEILDPKPAAAPAAVPASPPVASKQQQQQQQQSQQNSANIQTGPDGTQYYVVQNPDGTQNLVIKRPGEAAMITSLPKPVKGAPPQKIIIKQAPADGDLSGIIAAASPRSSAQGTGTSGKQAGSRSSPGQQQQNQQSSASRAPSATLQDKYSDKPPDVLINYNDDLQTGELGKTLDHGRVSIPRLDPKERAELVKQRDENQAKQKEIWDEKLKADDTMESEDDH
jgi:hypothetical protein